MVGYKIAFREERIESKDVFTGLYYETVIAKIPVLIVLDIPDDAMTSTPENRYTEENMNKIRDVKLKTFETVALRNHDTYLAYKDRDPLTIYNKFINDYDVRIFDYVHCVKCRCNIAKVVDIVGIFNGIHYYRNARSIYDQDFIYELYGTVRCNDFNTDNHMAVCAPGIHYFEYPVFAILHMMIEMTDLMVAVCDGKIDSRVAEKYLTEKLNTLRSDI